MADPVAPSIPPEPTAIAKFEAVKLQAQLWKQEAKTANATIAEIYRICTGGTGEPGNWNGAEPVRRALASQQAASAAMPLQRVAEAAREAMNASTDALDTINLPSHLAAALSLALDDLDAGAQQAASAASVAPTEPRALDHVECKSCGTHFWCERCGSHEPELYWQATGPSV